ncbi:MAG: hypothetical protein ABI480_07590 [Chitinophagaceae bacterium]
MKQKISMIMKSIAMIFAIFIAASVFDIVLSVVGIFVYSNAAFIVVFGVAGIFAGLIGYMSAMEKVPKHDRTASIGIIVMQVIIGLLFFSLIASIEGGEYKIPFKAFGLMLSLSSLVFLGKFREAAK